MIENVLVRVIGETDRLPHLRLAAVVEAFCWPLLQAVLKATGVRVRELSLTELLLTAAVDPNRRWPRLLRRPDCLEGDNTSLTDHEGMEFVSDRQQETCTFRW